MFNVIKSWFSKKKYHVRITRDDEQVALFSLADLMKFVSSGEECKLVTLSGKISVYIKRS